MATSPIVSPSITPIADPLPPAPAPAQPVLVQALEDPATLALRSKLVAAEDKQAVAAAAMATAGQAMADLLKPAAVTDAELWRGFAHAAIVGITSSPAPWGGSAAKLAAEIADGLVKECRARFP